MNTKLYMAVTPDVYELPLAVADTVNELAELTGKNPFTIYSAVRRNRLRGNKPIQAKKCGGARYYEVDCYEPSG